MPKNGCDKQKAFTAVLIAPKFPPYLFFDTTLGWTDIYTSDATSYTSSAQQSINTCRIITRKQSLVIPYETFPAGKQLRATMLLCVMFVASYT